MTFPEREKICVYPTSFSTIFTCSGCGCVFWGWGRVETAFCLTLTSVFDKIFHQIKGFDVNVIKDRSQTEHFLFENVVILTQIDQIRQN